MNLFLSAAESRTVIELIPDYLLFADPARHILSMSRSPWSDGLRDRIGKDFLEFIKPEHRPMVQAAVERVQAGESLVELEFEGAITGRWVHARIGAVREQGQVTELVLHLRDVEDLMLKEREMSRLRAALAEDKVYACPDVLPERFALMADALPILIAYVDSDQRYRYNNAAYERWFGVNRESLLGKRLGEVLGERASDEIRGYAASALEGRPVSFEMEVPFRNAGMRQVFVRFVPDIAPSGEVLGYFVLTEDVSEQRQAMARLRQREDELRQQQKMEALGSLATGIAHEFNNLLQVIVGGCQVLRQLCRGRQPQAEQVERLLGAAQRGVSLTRQLLSLGRLKSLDDRPLDLDSLLDDMTILLAPLLGSGIELRSRLRSRCGVYADAGELQQIVMNLAINARDAMPEGGCLRIETSSVDLDEANAAARGLRPGPHALLSFSDDGRGMDETTRARVFDPFFTTKPEGRGTGLGLPTVLRIVRRMRGHIEVQSAPGEGSCFRLYFPCLRSLRGDSLQHGDDERTEEGGRSPEASAQGHQLGDRPGPAH